MRTVEDFRDTIAGDLPTGVVWPREGAPAREAFEDVLAELLADVDQRVERAAVESTPAGADQLFTEWERSLGLPDPCLPADAGQVERRENLIEKYRFWGSQNPGFYEDLAARLGYDVTIIEHRPFRCGFSQCGGTHELGDPMMRYHWRVRVHEPRIVLFRTGLSEVGRDPLGFVRRAEDLECIFNRLKPAETSLTFQYEGI